MLKKIITSFGQLKTKTIPSGLFMYGYRSGDNDKAGYSLVNRTPSAALQNVLLQLATLPPKARVLDLGCGDGVLESHSRKQSYNVTALDIEPAAIHTLQRIFQAHNLGNVRTIIGDITQLESIPELANTTFDAIVTWRVIHSILPQHYTNIFHQIHQLLKPGSSFFVSVASNEDWKVEALGSSYQPNNINDCASIMFRDYGINRDTPFPIHFFSKEELVKLGEGNGFVLKEISSFQEPSGYTHLQHKMNTYLYAHFIAN